MVGIPSFPDPSHIGGIIDIGPDENLYFTVGNFQNTIPTKIYKTKTQNYKDGEAVDGRAGILRLTQDGLPVKSKVTEYLEINILSIFIMHMELEIVLELILIQ